MSSTVPALEWERAAGLQPRLAVDARIHRHTYRGVPWYVVQDGASARHVRLDGGAWRIAGLMDGARTLDEIHAAVTSELGEAGPSHEDVVRVFTSLHVAEVVECEQLESAQQLNARQQHHDRMRWRRLLASPLSQRIPLVDPQIWLDRWLPLVRPMLSPIGLLVWFVVAVGALGTIVSHWDAIGAELSADVLRPYNLALLVVAYIVVKSLHELGHAFATRAFGGEVHEMGVMLLVFVPVPYVDASSSSAFVDKGRRIVVGAAGIMVELFLGALALGVWLSVEPGLVRDFSFNVMLVGGISTLLFNGNPLLRFDGYYVLCDAIEIPNLGARSTRYLGYLVQRYLGGAAHASSPVSAAGERGWFLFYAPIAALYRLAVLIGIVLFVAQEYLVIGIVLGVWAALNQLVLPVFRGLVGLVGAPVLAGRRLRATLALGVPALAAAIVACAVPVPAWTFAEGLVWLPEHARVRAGIDGFVAQQVATRDARVGVGESLFVLRAPALRSDVTILERRLLEQQAHYDSALFHDRARLAGIEQQMMRLRAELVSARKQVSELLVRSPLAGRLLVPNERRLQGRFVRKGEVLGYVTDARPLEVRVVVRQDEIDRVREDTHAVWVKLPGYLDRTLSARIDGAVPSASVQLPGVALGTAGGGRIAVHGDDAQQRTAAESVFVIDVALPPDAPPVAAGTRVYLRFEHTRAPLAMQAGRAVRQLLLARFGV